MSTINNSKKYLTCPSTSSISSSSSLVSIGFNDVDKSQLTQPPNTTLTLYDLKLNSLQEPTTPIDKLNTPRTVTVKTATFFPPSPPSNQNNDTELGLTGTLKQKL